MKLLPSHNPQKTRTYNTSGRLIVNTEMANNYILLFVCNYSLKKLLYLSNHDTTQH